MFKRYANPFILLDEMIASGRLLEFVGKLLEIKNDEEIWEFFLHKVFDKSFDEFQKGVKKPQPEQNIDFGTTIQKSYDMLQGFVPE